MFEGSINFKPGDYDKHCLRAGGENNAYTTFDKTSYFMVLPSNHLETGLWLESDRMLGFAADESSLRKQIEVITEEKKTICDNKPYGSVDIELAPRLFKHSPYAWDIIGFPEEFEQCTLIDVKKFYDSFYIPSNAVLTITGDIDYKTAFELTEKYFGGITRNGNHTFLKKLQTPQEDEIHDVLKDNVQLPGIFIAYRIPEEYTPEYFAFSMLSAALTSGESSRLFRKLIYEKQLASEAGCYVDAREIAGVFFIYAFCMPGVKIASVIKEIDYILEDILIKGLSDAEYEKVLNKIYTGHFLRKQSITYKADALSHYELIHGNAELINSVTVSYEQISNGMIMKTASKFLINKNRVILEYLPV
jgi:predicted Zn-dependent peptidase